MKKLTMPVPEDLFAAVDRIANEHFNGDVALAFVRLAELGLAHFKAELKMRKELRKLVRALTRRTFVYRDAEYELWWEFTPKRNEFVALLLRGRNKRVVAVVLGSREPTSWKILWIHDESEKPILLELLEFHLREILDAEV